MKKVLVQSTGKSIRKLSLKAEERERAAEDV
jgi:hypothetical protein